MKANKLSLSVLCTLALILLLGLNSCTSEMGMNQEEENGPTATLMLNTNLSTRANGDEEIRTNTLRVLVYEVTGSGETVKYSEAPIGRSPASDKPTSVIQVKYPKCNQVAAFIIANEDPAWDLENKSYTVSDLKALKVTYSSTVATPFKMYAETDIFSGQYNATRVVSLVRNVARVDVKLTCSNSDLNLAKGAVLKLTKARILNMPQVSQLGQAISNYSGGYVNGSEVIFKEGTNYRTTLKGDVFDGFTTLGPGPGPDQEPGSITFYVPEHFVKEVGTYTYMTIEGKYYPNGEGADKRAINVIYTLPIGNTITTKKITGEEPFELHDLTIERNVKYLMAAQIKKIEQISDVVVSVQEWEPDPVSGDIEDKKISLNVSSIKTSIAQNAPDATLIQFWSNQPSKQVRILASGNMSPSGESFDVNTVFKELADTKEQTQRPANLWFNDTAAAGQQYKSWGHVALILKDNAVVSVGTVYTITLAAGSLHRAIKIEIIAPAVVQEKAN